MAGLVLFFDIFSCLETVEEVSESETLDDSPTEQREDPDGRLCAVGTETQEFDTGSSGRVGSEGGEGWVRR
jgi:hypothetical protein